jgi:hypothetical protein
MSQQSTQEFPAATFYRAPDTAPGGAILQNDFMSKEAQARTGFEHRWNGNTNDIRRFPKLSPAYLDECRRLGRPLTIDEQRKFQ